VLCLTLVDSYYSISINRGDCLNPTVLGVGRIPPSTYPTVLGVGRIPPSTYVSTSESLGAFLSHSLK
jgi:hypothetical protein